MYISRPLQFLFTIVFLTVSNHTSVNGFFLYHLLFEKNVEIPNFSTHRIFNNYSNKERHVVNVKMLELLTIHIDIEQFIKTPTCSRDVKMCFRSLVL